MKIQDAVRVELQNALGHAIPEPNSRDFATFYSQLELEHPDLAAKLMSAIEDDPPERPLFPEQVAQAQTRAQARSVLHNLFYRQDPYTNEWHLSKAKVGISGLMGMFAMIAPMLFLSPSSSRAATNDVQVVTPVTRPKPVAPRPPPKVDEPITLPAPTLESVPTSNIEPSIPIAQAPPLPSPPEPPPVTIIRPPPVASPAPAIPAPRPVLPATPPPVPGGRVFVKATPEKLGGATLYRRGDPKNNGQENTRLFVADQNSQANTNEATVFSKTSSEATAAQLAKANIIPGQILEGALATGIVVADTGQPVPVVFKTDNDVVFLGLATLNAARRMEIVFKEVVLSGQSLPLDARAFSTDGLPGVVVNVSETAPSLLPDLFRSSATGVSNFVRGLTRNTTTTLPDGSSFSTQSAPGLGASIAGALADLFSVPPEQKALVRISQVDRGTRILVTVLAVGAKSSFNAQNN